MPTRDYWFLVIDKRNTSRVVVNSIRGLTIASRNLNNLPFQINWNHNLVWREKTGPEVAKTIIEAMSQKDFWKTDLFNEMNRLCDFGKECGW